MRSVVYYVTAEFIEAYGNAIPPRPLWVRSILREPERKEWIIWQYHNSGQVEGIEGGVDLNVLSGGLDGLTMLGSQATSHVETLRRRVKPIVH